MRLKNKFFMLFITAILLSISACTPYAWIKQKGNPETFSKDNYACLQSSLKELPPLYMETPAATKVTVDTQCKKTGDKRYKGTTCRETVKEQIARPAQTRDLNANERNRLYNACMNAYDWFYVPVEDPAPTN